MRKKGKIDNIVRFYQDVPFKNFLIERSLRYLFGIFSFSIFFIGLFFIVQLTLFLTLFRDNSIYTLNEIHFQMKLGIMTGGILFLFFFGLFIFSIIISKRDYIKNKKNAYIEIDNINLRINNPFLDSQVIIPLNQISSISKKRFHNFFLLWAKFPRSEIRRGIFTIDGAKLEKEIEIILKEPFLVRIKRKNVTHESKSEFTRIIINIKDIEKFSQILKNKNIEFRIWR